MQINGVAHTFITAGSFATAREVALRNHDAMYYSFAWLKEPPVGRWGFPQPWQDADGL